MHHVLPLSRENMNIYFIFCACKYSFCVIGDKATEDTKVEIYVAFAETSRPAHRRTRSYRAHPPLLRHLTKKNTFKLVLSSQRMWAHETETILCRESCARPSAGAAGMDGAGQAGGWPGVADLRRHLQVGT